MNELDNWPGSQTDKIALLLAIGRFLRRHQNGGHRLFELLGSVPTDRTEEEFTQLRERARADNETGIQEVIDRINRRQARLGLPLIDRQGRLIRARNRRQAAAARSLCEQVATVVRCRGQDVSAKVVLRELNLPDERRRAVSRCLEKLRGRKVAKRRSK